MGEEKKGLWDNVHAKEKRQTLKKGDKNYPETLNVEDVNCDRKEMVAT